MLRLHPTKKPSKWDRIATGKTVKYLLISALFAACLAGASDAQGQNQPFGAPQDTNTTNCGSSMSDACSQAAQQGDSTNPNVIRDTGSSSSNAARPFTAPSYRDENALPTQSGSRASTNPPLQRELLTEFQKFVAQSTGQVLPIFGARLFRQIPTTFAPLDQIPVPADAVVGPGDLLRIRVWGQVNFSSDLRVDRSGEIYLPQIGPVHVAGLQYSDLDAHLQTAIARVYRNFSVSAQLGQIRSIQIYVAGRARRPGTYTVSSLSTLIDALFASGGPALDGSLRHIQLKRNGKVITDLDLYDLLVNGDKSGDVKLEAGDVIFVPVSGPQVAVLGSVKAPGIYELRLPETVAQVLEQAAGATNVANGLQLHLERMGSDQGRTTVQVALTSEGTTLPLRDGDILRLQPIVPNYSKAVTLRGNIASPGRYAWHEGMRLSDLIPERAALLTRNYWWERSRLGLPAPEFEGNLPFGRLTQPDAPETLPLRPGGINQPPDTDQVQLEQQQDPNGTGQTPDSDLDSRIFASAQSQQTQSQQTAATALRDAVTENTARATGINNVTLSAPEIDWSYAVIERLDSQTLKTSLIPFDLGRLVMDHDPSQDRDLLPGDVVTIFSQADIRVPVMQQTRLVRLEGEFLHAGVYSAQPGESLQDLVKRAGGLTPGAYLFGSEFTRVSVRAVQQKRLDEYVRQLQLEVERGVLATSASATSSAADGSNAAAASAEGRALVAQLQQVKATGRIVLDVRPDSRGTDVLPKLDLEDGDTYYVPRVPQNVSVFGAVYNQNAFVYQDGKRVRFYLHMAGGANRGADKRHPFIIRADGSVISRDQAGERRFEQVVIQPGDTIVFPEKTFGPSKLKEFLNFSQLFSQLAIGAAVASQL